MIYTKLKNARAYDPRITGILPQGVSADSNLAKFILRGAAIGDGVMLHGQAFKKSDDGSEVADGLLTVMANVIEGNNPSKNYTAGLLITSNADVARLDKLAAFELRYQNVSNVLAK